MREHVLSLNPFKMPKVFEPSDTNYILIIRLLLLEPGKIVSHPTMGVGIRSKYRFNNNDFLIALQDNIKQQIESYLPELAMTDISLKTDDTVLYIAIATSNGSYVLSYDTNTQQLNTGAPSYVLDNL